jgi:hypothetical protein
MSPAPREPKVSVVIVSYNTRDLLRRAVASVADEHETIVVDNASTDGSVEMLQSEYAEVRVIANRHNAGFGAANNQGVDAASGDLVLFMNSDACAEPGATATLASVFEDPGVVAAGGRLLSPDGTLQESACGELTLWAVFCEQLYLEKLFKGSRSFSPYWRSSRLVAEGDGPFEVAQVMGACLMMRPVERFDERFFLYCEDTDLCKRLARHGKILYVPTAVFHHELGAASQARWEAVARYNVGKEIYFRIHRGRFASVVCHLLNRMGAKHRMIAWSFAWLARRPSARDKAALFWKVLTAPIAGPPRPPDSD